MDSNQYRTRASALLQQAHELHQSAAATMTAIGDDAGTAEWQTLYAVLNAVGVACDIMRESLHPHPSMFADAEVPMACTVCLEPVEPFNVRSWQHKNPAHDMRSNCATGGLGIKAMVAAGATRAPLDTV